MGLIIVSSSVLLVARIASVAWRGSFRFSAGAVYLPLILFLGYVSVQAVLWRTDGGFWSVHTVERHSTILYLLLAFSCTAILFLVHNGFDSRRWIRWLMIGVLALGSFESLYGLVQYLGGHEFIWHFERISYRGLATGTFINRNHYALFLNLAISVGVGFLYYRSRKILGKGNAPFWHIIVHPAAAKLLWILLIVALMGLALVFSMSRMGIAAMLGSIGMMIAAVHSAESGRRGTVIGALLLAIVVVLAVYTGIEPVIDRFEKVGKIWEEDQDRIAIWKDAWPMVKENVLFGQGLGSFQWTYPAYETMMPDRPARYAHNDYLQALAEVGGVGLLLLLAAAVALGRTALKNLRNSDPLTAAVGLMTIGVLTAVALQEITDFGLYIPGVAVLVAVLAGLNLRAARTNRFPQADDNPNNGAGTKMAARSHRVASDGSFSRHLRHLPRSAIADAPCVKS
ncbi:MAG: O-antigen ligase family protein [Acidobacteriota bacterium]|nr:O-antigen ligase family protein [Acidobacteriota bacterium]